MHHSCLASLPLPAPKLPPPAPKLPLPQELPLLQAMPLPSAMPLSPGSVPALPQVMSLPSATPLYWVMPLPCPGFAPAPWCPSQICVQDVWSCQVSPPSLMCLLGDSMGLAQSRYRPGVAFCPLFGQSAPSSTPCTLRELSWGSGGSVVELSKQ